MKEFQQRVVTEREELEKKRISLNVFIGTTLFFGLRPAEQCQLRDQLKVMTSYSDILKARIDAFKSFDSPQAHELLKPVINMYYTAQNVAIKYHGSKAYVAGDIPATATQCDLTRGEFFIAVCEWAKSKGAVI